MLKMAKTPSPRRHPRRRRPRRPVAEPTFGFRLLILLHKLVDNNKIPSL
jgi:hypothetical protein